jgi:hypothetical protein
MNPPTDDKPSRQTDRVRRDSHNTSPPGFRKETYRSHEKMTSQPMSRDNSWDRHSGTASYVDSASVHTADDSVFSEPERHGRRSRPHSDIANAPTNLRSRNLPPRQESFGRPHPSHIYDDVDRRQPKRGYPPPNDYPHEPQQRETFYEDPAFSPRPALHRHNSVQTPQSNPFDISRYPARLPRSNTYGPGMHEPMYGQREPRYLTDRPAQGKFQLEELADALEQIREQKRKPLFGRRASDWDGGYERERMGVDYGYDSRRY